MPDFSAIIGPATTQKMTAAPDLASATAIGSDAYSVIDQSLLAAKKATMDSQADVVNQGLDLSQQVFKSMNDAQTARQAVAKQAETVDALPNVVSNLVGLFDPDFNKKVLADRDAAAQLKIQQGAQTIDQIQTVMKAKSDLLTNNLGLISDQATAATTSIDRTLKVRQQMQADQQLALQNKYQAAENARANSAEARAQTNQQFLNQQHTLTTLNDDKLADIAAGKTDGGAGISQFSAKEEQMRRASGVLQFQGIQNAMAADDINLTQKRKELFLSSQNGNTLDYWAQEAAKNNGKVDIKQGDVTLTFTSRELAGGLTQVATDEEATTKKLGDQAATIGMTDHYAADAQQTASIVGTIAGADSGYTNSMLNTLSKATAEVKLRQHVGDYEGAGTVMKAANDEIEKQKEAYLASLPDAERPFVRARTEAVQPTPQQAVAFLGSAALNPNLLGQVDKNGNVIDPTANVDSRYAPMFQSYTKSLHGLVIDAGGTITTDENGKMVFSSKSGAKFDSLSNAAVAGAKDAAGNTIGAQFQNNRNVTALDQGLQALAQINPQAFGGVTSDQFKNAQGVVSTNQLLNYLRTRFNNQTVAAQEAMKKANGGAQGGHAMDVQPYDQQLLQYMRGQEFQQNVNKYWTSGLTNTGLAVATMANGGNPLQGFNDYIDGISNAYQTFNTQQGQAEAAHVQQEAAIAGRTQGLQEYYLQQIKQLDDIQAQTAPKRQAPPADPLNPRYY